MIRIRALNQNILFVDEGIRVRSAHYRSEQTFRSDDVS